MGGLFEALKVDRDDVACLALRLTAAMARSYDRESSTIGDDNDAMSGRDGLAPAGGTATPARDPLSGWAERRMSVRELRRFGRLERWS